MFQTFLQWLYSANVTMPESIFEVVELFFMAYDFSSLDLMHRCENELVNRITATSVTDLLIKIFPQRKRESKIAKSVDDDSLLQQLQPTVQQKYDEQITNILSVAQKFFLAEFTDVLIESTGEEIETKLASVPGLIISLFQGIEQQKSKRRNRLGRVTFSTVEEVQYAHGSDSIAFSDTHSEGSRF